jgi:hypothetical protein
MRNKYLVDVWEDLKSGATIAVPVRAELRQDEGICIATVGGDIMVVQLSEFLTPGDEDARVAEFEASIMQKYPRNWVRRDTEPTFRRPDGLVLRRQTFGRPGAPSSRTVSASLVEIFASRKGTVLGVAHVSDWTCGGTASDCANKRVSLIPLAASFEVTTFGITASRRPGMTWRRN